MMSHQINFYNGALTIRLDGHVHTQETLQDIRQHLDELEQRAAVILDMTLCTGFDQQFKSMLYRILQGQTVAVVGICGINEKIEADVRDLLVVLSRVRRVVVKPTEGDVLSELGLAPTPERKFTGMLAYLKKE